LGIIYKLLEGSQGDRKEVVPKKDKKKFKKKWGGWRIVIPMPEAEGKNSAVVITH
jgi:hypothetical protein